MMCVTQVKVSPGAAAGGARWGSAEFILIETKRMAVDQCIVEHDP